MAGKGSARLGRKRRWAYNGLPYSGGIMAFNTAGLIAQRALDIDASGIRKVFDLAAKMKDPINLSIGQPDFDVPEPLKEKAIEAIRKGMNRYTPTQGIAELLAPLKAKTAAETG